MNLVWDVCFYKRAAVESKQLQLTLDFIDWTESFRRRKCFEIKMRRILAKHLPIYNPNISRISVPLPKLIFATNASVMKFLLFWARENYSEIHNSLYIIVAYFARYSKFQSSSENKWAKSDVIDRKAIKPSFDRVNRIRWWCRQWYLTVVRWLWEIDVNWNCAYDLSTL